MAEFKVSAERIEILAHPNAERLEIAKVGMYALVIAKGQYADGDIVVFAPKRAILPEELRGNYVNEQTGQSYLKRGAIVRSVRLRGELSEGVTLDKGWVMKKLHEFREETFKNAPEGEQQEWLRNFPLHLEHMIGVDLSKALGIDEDIPHIPAQFAGVQSNIKATAVSLHDCESLRLHAREFQDYEAVIVSEKIHGTQINIIFHEDDETVEIGSKGLLKKGVVLEEAEGNIYWRAFRASGLLDIKRELFPGKFVQIMGEVIPAQKGFDYGFSSEDEPVIKIFRLELDRKRVTPVKLRQGLELQALTLTEEAMLAAQKSTRVALEKMWVPWELTTFDVPSMEKMAKGMEGVSGKQRHIKEGVVVEPLVPRNAERGNFPLIIKVINPKYKGDDEDMS